MFPIQGNQPDGTLYVDDVFSTYLYTGNGSTKTITNGIDLAGKGGMVWIKARNLAAGHYLVDISRGTGYYLRTNTTDAQGVATGISFSSTGWATTGDQNGSSYNYASWTFRRAARFFDCGTYVGNGVAGRQIPHSLGVAPGMVVIKRIDSAGGWVVWHRSTGENNYLSLNLTNVQTYSATGWGGANTSTHFYISDDFLVNISGATYVWYAFAHDTSADGIIQCGSFTTDGGGNATVNLGWEPQWLVEKGSNVADSWWAVDTMRGWEAAPSAATKYLTLNSSDAESTWGTAYEPTATGFKISQLTANKTFIYLAIRRPNKPPTSGTQVYNAIARTGTGAAATVTGVGFAPDLASIKSRNSLSYEPVWYDRLRGSSNTLFTSTTDSELTNTGVTGFDQMGGVVLGDFNRVNANTVTYINHFFRRAPGVFDVVCYTGNDTLGTAISHSLAAVPEMMIIKARTKTDAWMVYHKDLSGSPSFSLSLNSTANGNQGSAEFGNTTPTITSFYVGGATAQTNDSTITYVAYLFATKPGISKVGSYTGNGSSQTINCGFTAGSRFILIKRTDSTGDWFVWDSTRGIVAGNDPHLSLNTTAAEVTTDDSIDPDNSGFIVNQLAATNINVTSATYIFLSFA